jgi:hypothetical protein
MAEKLDTRELTVNMILGVLDYLDGQGIVFVDEDVVKKALNELSLEELQTISR